MCFRFLPGNEPARQLRGGPLFERSAANWARWPLRWLSRGHIIWAHHPGESVRTVVRGCEGWFVPMPANPALSEILERRPFATLAVDYHADVLGLLHPDDASPDALRAGAHIGNNWTWWNHPDRISALTRGLVAADVITTPWPEYLGPLVRTFGRPVFLLPDTHPGDVRAFTRAWKGNVRPAMSSAAHARRLTDG